jgi:LacI family transcriptional regulator
MLVHGCPGAGAVMDDRAPDTSEIERPTLKTIAALTGLAVATVSRALRDAPDIGEETKRRVREVAARIGYRPNRAGVRLRTGKTQVIALVRSTEEDVMNHTSQMINAIAAALRGTSYHMILMPYFPEEDAMAPIRYIVETGSADGVIINQTEPEDARVRYMAERGFPFATHGRTDMGIAHPYFDFDNEVFARLMVRQMAGRGRRRLALVAPPRQQSYAQHMIKGFTEEAAAQGCAAEVFDGVTSDTAALRVEAFARTRLAAPDRPDGIVLGSATSSMAFVSGGEACGLVLGRDFDVGTKDSVHFLRRFRRDMLVVYEDVALAGGFLARAVMDAIDHRPGATARQYLDVPALLE